VPLCCPGDHGGYLFGISDVDDGCRAGRGQLGDGVFGRRLVSVGDDHRRTTLGEADGGGPADPAGPARDDHGLPVEVHGGSHLWFVTFGC